MKRMASISKSNKNKINSKNKKRFSDEQISLMESMFENETRPELQIKQKLANQLGLQPRQIAIWFQNKRARSKSKLIELEYYKLKESYDTLASEFQSLKEEKQSLLTQLENLRNLMGDRQGSNNGAEGTGRHSDGEFNSADNNNEEERTNIFLNSDNCNNVPQYNHSSENLEYYAEDTKPWNFSGIVIPHDHSTTCENWCDLESSCVLDQPSFSSYWWELQMKASLSIRGE